MSDYDVIVIGSGAGGGTLVAPPGARRASGSCCSSAATGCRASRRTGSPQDVFVDNRYVSPDTWYDDDGKPFQPQVHYFVGGATKLYGAALYRLRARGLRRAAPPRRHLARVADRLRRDGALLHAGRAALPGARRARRGPDRAAGERALPVPGGLARAAHPAARRRPRGRRATTRSTRPAACMLDEAQHALQRAASAAPTCDGFPCLVHAKSDAEVLAVRPGARAPQRHAAHERRGRAARDRTRRARRSPGSWSSATASARRYAADIVVVSCGAANSRQAAARLGAATRTRTGWPTAPTRSGATTCSTTARRCWRCRKEPNPTVFQKTLGLNDFYFGERRLRVPARQHPDGRQVAGRRCSAARSRCETKLAPQWTLERRRRATRSTSGSRPRTCRGPRTASRCDRDGQRHARLHADQRGAEGAALRRSSSRCSGTWACTRDHLFAAPRLHEERDPGRRRRAPGGHLPLRHAIPATSVLDADCKAHELDNLYVVDTSFFPSIGAVNPALTAMANALRVGDHLLERLGARRRAGGRRPHAG